MNDLTSIEMCAGAGGQALGIERAGFQHEVLVEIEHLACETLRNNRPNWNVLEKDLQEFDASKYIGQIDLLAGGVPCPPFSIAGKQLGKRDDRDLFPEAIRVIRECNPKAIMLENVRGILSTRFEKYRKWIIDELSELGYSCEWRLLNSSDYGVSQLRPRAILVGFRGDIEKYFKWPEKHNVSPLSIGELLFNEMSSNGWEKASDWKLKANSIGPTIVGGSKKHGGADLGPTRAKKAWAELGVNGGGLADHPPEKGFFGNPKLTLKMTALVQGFPKEWTFIGKKTPAYRQVGNAFPPPVAEAVGKSIIKALRKWQKEKELELEQSYESIS